jgi:hypothetical protein
LSRRLHAPWCGAVEQHPGEVGHFLAAYGAGHEHGEPLAHKVPACGAAGELDHCVLCVEGGNEALGQANDLVIDSAVGEVVG